jgi:DNA polymerase-3 subunit alpha
MDGISLPEEIVKAAKEKGLKSIAITDHGHCHAHADIYLTGKKLGVRTILGVEAYVIHDLAEWHALKDKVDIDRKSKGKAESEEDEYDDESAKSLSKQLTRKGHLVLLACNREGLSNIYQLTFEAHRDGFYGKPRMDKKMLSKYAKGIVASSACMGGVIANKCWAFKRGEIKWDDVVSEAREFDSIFGRGRFFLELQFNESDDQRFINECLVRVHNETGIPLTATTDSHYVGQDDWEAQEVLYMLRGKTSMATRAANWSFNIKQLYIKSPAEMWQSFEKFGGTLEPRVAIEAFQNTLLIDSLIEDFEPDVTQRLPTLKDVPNPFKKMGELAIAQLKARGLDKNEKYVKQLMHELQVIKDKGISAYFLITKKIISEAKKEMLVGAGRGSSAGSLVCYLLDITDLDPIEHNLMFERFLDPSRVELPDIDVDFQDVDRTKDLLRDMFGTHNVACLSVYGTHQIKGLLKDLGRVYDVDHNEINLVNRKIESELRVLHTAGTDKNTLVITLKDLEDVSPSFNSFIEKHPEVGKHLKKLYWKNRHVGRHASGVIIGDNLPAETAIFLNRGVVQCSFTEGIVGKNLSAMGFVKFDILSIATLGVIDHAMKSMVEHNASMKFVKITSEDGREFELNEGTKVPTKNRGVLSAKELNEDDEIDEALFNIRLSGS